MRRSGRREKFADRKRFSFRAPAEWTARKETRNSIAPQRRTAEETWRGAEKEFEWREFSWRRLQSAMRRICVLRSQELTGEARPSCVRVNEYTTQFRARRNHEELLVGDLRRGSFGLRDLRCVERGRSGCECAQARERGE